jgi:hypothetical protein
MPGPGPAPTGPGLAAPMRLTLLQLPVPPPAAYAATGNVPLAAGCLAVAARDVEGLTVEVVPPSLTDRAGDTQLAEHVAAGAPAFLGLSLYLWNVERSLHVAREVKRRSPGTTVLVGGPEVGPDNPWVLEHDAVDIAVTGEAEPVFAEVMRRLVAGEDPAGLPGVAVRGGAFTPAAGASFPLTAYPSPYLAGTVPVDPARSTYVESVRGCRSHCTYCFYPKSSSVLRTLDVDATASLVAAVRDRGARFVTFLDPTFNHRPQFEALVEALAQENAERRLSFFAEVRSEGLTANHAKALARAGFDKLELGLQSVNRATLARVKRHGDPNKVATAAKMLKDEGIDLLIDLIVGLPGDTEDDVARGVDFLLEHGLGEHAQVFLLSLLPGTEMRRTAEADGVVFSPRPPYKVLRTATMDADALLRALLSAEEALGRRVDEWARPHLVTPGGDDGFVVDVDAPEAPSRPGARHQALWLTGADLAARPAVVLEALDTRLRVDPYATLDVVLAPRVAPSDRVLDAVWGRLIAAPGHYLSRALAHRGENLGRRLVAVDQGWPAADVARLSSRLPVFRDQGVAQAREDAEHLGGTRPGARIVGPATEADFAALDAADPETVVFADPHLEARWQATRLGYGE